MYMDIPDKRYNRNSMRYWFPAIKGLPIPQPRTEFVLERESWLSLLDGEMLEEHETAKLRETAREIGYPLFMRSDLASGKHDYVHTCYIENEETLIPNLYHLVDDNAMHDQYFSTLVLREFIYLDWKFKAFGGLPIAPERRYFVEDGSVLCRHSYWPEESIRFYRESKKWENTQWKTWLKELNQETDIEIAILTSYAKMVSHNIEGAWSVDFAKARGGTWFLIDMATAKKSYHDPECEKYKVLHALHGGEI